MPSKDSIYECVNGSQNELHLPLIDLSLLPSHELEQGNPDVEILCRQIREACEEWGFFRVINHGIAPNVITALDSQARGLFALPEEIKQRAAASIGFNGYGGPSAKSPFAEGMTFPRALISDSIQHYSHKLWPHGNSEFCQEVRDYCTNLTRLAKTILKLILHSLGPHMCSKYYQSDFGNCEGYLRMNHYFPSVTSSEIVVNGAHKDLSCLTILCQDDAGGLEVRSKEGGWLSVKPLPNSFVINIGDSFKIWSNDRYRSAEHRVVYEGWKSRLSLAFFWHLAEDVEIRVPAELIDDEHPQRYKPILFKDFRQFKAREALNSEPPIRLPSGNVDS
eukprot:Gb_27025 [translate_table: standard]